MPVLESDIERKIDLDTEIKASGCFNAATTEQMDEYDRLNEEYLQTRDNDVVASEDDPDIDGEDLDDES